MRDQLRRQALESGKTISRKAQSKQSSRASSVANSRTASANVSANVSENGDGDDDGYLSDSTNSSYNGIHDMSLEAPQEEDMLAWKTDVQAVIEEITDRKRSSNQGREKSLASYNYILTHRYASNQISSQLSELVAAFLKSIKKEDSEKETILAITALSLTAITCPENAAYESVASSLKKTYVDSQSVAVKAAAIHGRAIASTYGGAEADENDTEEMMSEYLEIIESDGNFIEAGDSHEVVLAALEAWGFLATFAEDLEDVTQEAIEAFVEQLESSNPHVQIAAGENIALLFEKSYTETEEGEVDESNRPINLHTTPFTKRYDAYRQTHQLKEALKSLASERHRYLPKKDQKVIHMNFKDILRTVEDPMIGPRCREDENGVVKYMKVTVGKSGPGGDGRWARRVTVDKWWKLHRLDTLRRLLGSGFLLHYQDNDVIEETLPSSQMEVTYTDKPSGLRNRGAIKEDLSEFAEE